jgi:hypothetical protein
MFITQCYLRRFVLVVFGVIFLSTPYHILHAQAESEDGVSNATTTNQTIVIEAKPVTLPYELEALQGDKIFNDFVLSPGKIELEIKPGESKTVQMTVSNRIDKFQTFKFEIEDIAGSRDAARSVVLLGDDTGPYSLKDYVSLPHMTFDLAYNRRALIPVTISVPPNAEPGGMYGSVLVQTVTKEANADTSAVNPAASSAIVSRIGALFFITVPGEADTQGSLTDFSTLNKQKWFDQGPINFALMFENNGSVHLNPYGEIRITNMFDEEVGFEEIEPWFALPDSERLREISWNREFMYGRYKATVNINRGYNDIIDEATITFWVIPWKIVVGSFAVLFVIFFVFRGFFRRFEFKRKEP